MTAVSDTDDRYKVLRVAMSDGGTVYISRLQSAGCAFATIQAMIADGILSAVGVDRVKVTRRGRKAHAEFG